MSSKIGEYVIVPGTGRKLYDGTIVILSRLPDVKWLVHCGFFEYEGVKQKGWYLSKIADNTVMPLFSSDLLGIRIEGDCPCPPRPPIPPPPRPIPPTPGCIFTPEDKEMILKSMITVDTLEQRDKLGSEWLQNGKIVRVNNPDGTGVPEYYSWNTLSSGWEVATLGYRYMTRSEIEQEIAQGVVGIEYSDSEGALVVTAHDGTSIKEALNGIAHDPIYADEDLTLRIPIFGKPDLVIRIARNEGITGVEVDEAYEWPDHSIKPTIIIHLTDGVNPRDVLCDATSLYNTYIGSETDSVKVIVQSDTNQISANVRIAAVEGNALQSTSAGLVVDVSGKVDKQDIADGLLLVSDGLGGFTKAGNGVSLFTEGTLSDIGDRGVVTANLITGAIDAAINELSNVLSHRMDELEQRVQTLEANSIQSGASGEIVITTEEGVQRSGLTIGGDELSTEDINAVATEAAVKKAIAWTSFVIG